MIIVLTAYPDMRSAEKSAENLLDEGLAACVNMIQIGKSIYRWKGRIRKEKEYLLLIKTTIKAYRDVEIHIKKNHPYDIPEVIYLKASGGDKDYIRWLEDNISSRLFSVPLDFKVRRRADTPSREERRARKPRISLR